MTSYRIEFIPNDKIKEVKLEKIVRGSDALKWHRRRHPDKNDAPKGTGNSRKNSKKPSENHLEDNS